MPVGDGQVAPALIGKGRRRALLIFQVIGFALLVAAVVVAINQRDTLWAAIDSARAAPAHHLALVLALPILNWLLIGGLFFVLTGQYGRVGLGEMTIVVGSAWLLNLLPMRPGLMSRVAYQKLVNHVSVRDSVKITVFSVATQAFASGLVIGALALVFALRRWAGLSDADARALLIALGAGLLVLLGGLSFTLRQRGAHVGGPAPIDAWRLTAGTALRLADACVWTARYTLAFSVIGHEITLVQAAGVGVVSQIVGLTPVQLGLREWAVGVCGRFLPATAGLSTTGARTAIGLAADLLNRAAEIAVSLPVGLVCTWWVWRRLRRAMREGGG
jgi:hypothetical protein